MPTRTPIRVLLVAALTLALLPMFSTFAPGGQVAGFTTASPAAADQIWYQSVGRTDATVACEKSTTTELAAGWTQWAPSWDTWVNGSKGGFVCNRQITWAFDSVPPSSSGSGSSSVTCTTTSGGTTVIPCAVSTSGSLVYGPGGGIVFYDAGTEQSWGRFMEAAPKTWSGGTADPTGAWCNDSSTLLGGTFDTAIGTGKANTDLMIAGCTGRGAANGVRAYGTATAPAGSWFLPSLAELNQLYAQKVVVGGLAAAGYWSSSQGDASLARGQCFCDGVQFNVAKYFSVTVRPVRAF